MILLIVGFIFIISPGLYLYLSLTSHFRKSKLFAPNAQIWIGLRTGGCIVYGATRVQARYILESLSVLPTYIQSAISEIRVYQHFGGRHFNLQAGAHCHSNGTICLRRGMLSRILIWHEAAHAHTFMLPIAEIENFARLINNDSSKLELTHEAIAKLVTASYCRCFGTLLERFLNPIPKRHSPSTRAQLAWLEHMKFITPDQYTLLVS